MSPSPRIEIEVRRTPHGPLHVYRCNGCEEGKVLVCHHGANCDCHGFFADCEDCDGTAELAEENCDCSTCAQVREDMEEKPSCES